jgi:hypothetical protein
MNYGALKHVSRQHQNHRSLGNFSFRLTKWLRASRASKRSLTRRWRGWEACKKAPRARRRSRTASWRQRTRASSGTTTSGVRRSALWLLLPASSWFHRVLVAMHFSQSHSLSLSLCLFSPQMIPTEHFIPVFEEEFCPEDVQLNEQEKTALLDVLDAYPRDGCVSVVEWKRFCKQSKKSGRSLYGFIRLLEQIE